MEEDFISRIACRFWISGVYCGNLDLSETGSFVPVWLKIGAAGKLVTDA